MPIQTVSQAYTNEGLGGFTYRNRIINGDMKIDQRNNGAALAAGTSAAGAYTMDRWASYTGTGSIWQLQRVNTGNLDFPFAMRAQRIAGQTSTNAIYYAQIVESVNTHGLAGQTVTLSFYVTAGSNYSGGSSFGFQLLNGTGTDEGMSSMNSGTWTGAAYPGTTLTPTTTRTRITFTTTLGVNVREIAVRFYWAGAGTAGANDFVDITGVQLELGSSTTPFEYRTIGTELSLCHRYFYQSENFGTNSVSLVSNDFLVYGALSSTFEWMFAKSKWPVKMRTGPGAASTSDAAGNIGKVTIMTSTGGVSVNNVTPYTVYVNSEGYAISVYNEAKYGFFGAIRASAEL
jgi:hypothetical protein